MPSFEQLADQAVDSAEVAWLVSKRAAAVRSRDAEYLASRYAPGVVTFGFAPPLSVDPDEASRLEWLRRWFERFRGRIGYVVQDLTVSVAGDHAFCHSRDELIAWHAGRRRHVVRFETTLGLRRANGIWLIASEHVSAGANV